MSATQYRSAFEVVSNPQARHPLASWSSDRSAINRDLLVVGAFCVVGLAVSVGLALTYSLDAQAIMQTAFML